MEHRIYKSLIFAVRTCIYVTYICMYRKVGLFVVYHGPGHESIASRHQVFEWSHALYRVRHGITYSYITYSY